MTFSLVARCAETGQLGVAAATAAPAVGKLLTWAAPGAGAIATQSWINPYLGFDGLALLREGVGAEAALDRVLARDAKRALRQVGVVAAGGEVAVWTGASCEGWAGHITGEGYCAQGNVLVGRKPLEVMAESFVADEGIPLARRLMRALTAGEAAGGDKRGCRSATMYIVEHEDYPLWDLRVDDHPSPFDELYRLFDVFEREVVADIRKMARRGADPNHYDTEGPERLA